MKQYLELLDFIMKNGESREDRTGTGTQSWFGQQVRFNLADGFPLVTTKKCHLRSIIHELLWFLSGDTNIDYLTQNKVKIWDEWADENGDLGPVYGFQWRHWGAEWPVTAKTPEAMRGIDQIERLVHGIKTDPYSRRHIVSGWNVSNVNAMALPPCHTMFQFYVHGDNRLSCQLYQRSADVFLGVPFNIASYALFTLMLAQQCEMKPGWFVHSFGDLHLYSNHVDQAKLQLTREPHPLPTMKINPDVQSIFDYKFEDFELVGYDPHPGIKAKVAV